MKNKIIIFLCTLNCSLLFSQVGIGTNTPDPDAILELKSSNKALLLTRVALTGTNDITTIPTPTAGMIVYNTATTSGNTAVKANQIYKFDGFSWDYFVDNTNLTTTVEGFSVSSLGYTPVKASAKNIVTTVPGTSVTATSVGCKTNPANGHVYCAYQLSSGVNFYDTFKFAKAVGGYIVTMTNNAERIWVNTNLLANGTGYNLNSNIWIGYNKVAYPGNSNEFVWITNEDWAIDWTTSPTSTPESWFDGSEPNNSGGTEGSCHIWSTGQNVSRKWNDLNGNSTAQSGNPFNQVIIEFNEE